MDSDDVRRIVLIVHIAAGATSLLLAVAVMAGRARQDWSSRWGTAYVGGVVTVAVSAIFLAIVGSSLPAVVRWVLAVVAVATALAAVRGFQLVRRPGAGAGAGRGGSRPGQLRLMWGSVTSLASATAIVSAPVFIWVPVVIAGTILTELGYQRARRDPAWA